jgi:hypothetical protein
MPENFTDLCRDAAPINTPLGAPGSGRQRYAAAMALYQSGKICPQALEIYRICSPLDHQDPSALLSAAGQPQIPKV